VVLEPHPRFPWRKVKFLAFWGLAVLKKIKMKHKLRALLLFNPIDIDIDLLIVEA
jgi:hypothetical protein